MPRRARCSSCNPYYPHPHPYYLTLTLTRPLTFPFPHPHQARKLLELQRENALNPAQVEHYHKFMLQSSFYIELAAALPCATRASTPP